MTGDWRLADEFLPILKRMAADPVRPGFEHFGHTHLYGAVDRDTARQIIGTVIDNKARAVMRSRQLGAMCIEDTRGTIFRGV